ncbi:DUF6464 family protein [Nostoc sp. FACHB-110]|uniref:DUF6464 family protein n=1 Tax=Nostoc sp. FACHB-110 TaxID=2692834 RepID=UPI0016846308|nr:DUF6464 family protein [Nostoc sp. FACHB-110]MBD2436934.1 hypothetical protein [Nostoc sp. FACHB-110]
MHRALDFMLLAFCSSIWFLLGMLSAIASPRVISREESPSQKHQNLLEEFDCLFNARSVYLQCAVNPQEDCTRCIYLAEYREWYKPNL